MPDAQTAKKAQMDYFVLDEMNPAPRSTGGGLSILILIQGWTVLPDNVLIVAAGNRDADKGVVYRMSHPLANRFVLRNESGL